MKSLILSRKLSLPVMAMVMMLFGFQNLQADCSFGDIDTATDPLAGCSGVVTITGTFTISSQYNIFNYPISELVIDGGEIVWTSNTFMRLPANCILVVINGGTIGASGLCTNSTRLDIDDQSASCTGEGTNVDFSFADIVNAEGFDRDGLLPIDCTFGDIQSSNDPFAGCTGEVRITGTFTIDGNYNNTNYTYPEVIIDGGQVLFAGNHFWRLPNQANLCLENGGAINNSGTCSDGMRIAVQNLQISCTGEGGGAPVSLSFEDVNLNEGCVDKFGLPIELLTFEGKREKEEIMLTWSTGHELDNDYMAVERSSNGLDFDEIGRVSGKGTSFYIQDYAFADKAPQSGINYYRLRQVDFDGTTEYHPVISVVFDGQIQRRESTLTAYPNPVNDELSIKWFSSFPGTGGVLRVFDTNGRLLREQEIAGGSGVYNLPVQDLAGGIYTIQLMQNGQTQTERFIKN